MSEEFAYRTLKGYQLAEKEQMTPAMEDYLEMICRVLRDKDSVRIHELSELLNVKASSASKMASHLDDIGYVKAEKYGSIALTDEGRAAGNYLIFRHNVIHRFLCCLNSTENELCETEKIEHFISRKTVENLSVLTRRLTEEKDGG